LQSCRRERPGQGRPVRLARKERLGHPDFIHICQQARSNLGLLKPEKEHKLPQLLSEADFKRFFRVLQGCGDLQQEIMLKLLFYTAVRVSELVGNALEVLLADGRTLWVAPGLMQLLACIVCLAPR
jgi:integrase